MNSIVVVPLNINTTHVGSIVAPPPPRPPPPHHPPTFGQSPPPNPLPLLLANPAPVPPPQNTQNYPFFQRMHAWMGKFILAVKWCPKSAADPMPAPGHFNGHQQCMLTHTCQRHYFFPCLVVDFVPLALDCTCKEKRGGALMEIVLHCDRHRNLAWRPIS